MKKLSVTRARQMVEEICEQAPHTKFDPKSGVEGCRYFDYKTGEPVCLVGHLIAKLGFTYHDMADHDSNRRAIDRIDWLTSLTMTDNAVTFLRSVQRIQDNGYSWGHILQALRETNVWRNV